MFTQETLNRIGIFGSNNNDHADAAVKGSVHFLGFHIARLLKPLEELGQFPRFSIDLCNRVFRQHARHVFGNAAAGNVCHTFNGKFFQSGKNRFHIQTGRRNNSLPQGFAIIKLGIQIGIVAFDDFTDKGIAV
ncbi:Uncharacterised protein [Neisseria meningitidis]|nr:Uncharacterised protein [Neisseria meningitidis]CWQ47086.1 Uncharacterised protein [Neisseria meningitidis]CWQ51378.1 Uncharacterised protein [Neisseria meningitidis]CWQ72828.1 Uncharacterised protein [Neisseria meningitidis]CWR77436.1 Uncharacterised protein [Neisseria meningitidis]